MRTDASGRGSRRTTFESDERSTRRLRLARALLVFGMAASAGCRGRNLIGAGGDGGAAGGPGGSPDGGVTPAGDAMDAMAAPPDGSTPTADAATTERSAFGRAVCLLRTGQHDRAHEALVAYRDRFPRGRFSAEVARMLGTGAAENVP